MKTTTPEIWLRSETKPAEQRTPLTPDGAGRLLDAGFAVTVEDCPQRIFLIDDYKAAGCDIAERGSWPDAPADAFVLGLKELPEGDFPLVHRHIYFAHVYKAQSGAEATLGRFVAGSGTLYDLEYLTHENGRRVAAFGFWAGYCGAALGVMAWANAQASDAPPLAALESRPSKDHLLEDVSATLGRVSSTPAVFVVGAKGRSGSGASEFAHALDLETIEWDIEETRRGGPFAEINDADVFVNCVLVDRDLPPFVTIASLSDKGRRLSVIADVSCDPYGSYNPVPIYDRTTTFREPTLAIDAGVSPLHLIAIDHLPSLLPKESSEDYGGQLLPHLLTLGDTEHGAWQRASAIFADKTRHLANRQASLAGEIP